jgi:hypothetical protein
MDCLTTSLIRARCLLCWAFLCSARLAAPAICQVPPDAASAATDIGTDRPAVTNSSAVVREKVFQTENGLLYTTGQPHSTLDLPASLIRVGVGESTELRLTAPDFYYDDATPVGPRSGFGDLTIGLKRQLDAPGGFQIAPILSLSLPTGSHGISSHGYDPSVQLPWSRKLSAHWTAAGMLSVYVPTENGSHAVAGESTFLIDRQITKPWDAFVEYVGDFPDSGGPRHLLHFGTAYKVNSQQQLDVHVGVGLSAAAMDHFVGLGYSFRFRMAKH